MNPGFSDLKERNTHPTLEASGRPRGLFFCCCLERRPPAPVPLCRPPPPHPVGVLSIPVFTVALSLLVSAPPEHTMATPLEDVGKQVGRSRPLPAALQGLLRALGHPPFLPPLPSRCGGVPCSWQTTSCSSETSSRVARCWSSGRAPGWPASSQPPWHRPCIVQVMPRHPGLQGSFFFTKDVLTG